MAPTTKSVRRIQRQGTATVRTPPAAPRLQNVPAQTIIGAGIWAQGWESLQYNPSELVTKRGIEIYDRMLRSDQIKAALTFKTESVLATGWQVISPPSRAPDWDVTAFTRRRLDNISHSFEHSLRTILSAMIYGYSITERVYKIIPEGEDKGMVGIDLLKTKPPQLLRFKLDKYGNIIGIINDQDRGDLDPAKFVIWSYASTFGNPYGVSELETCYRPFILEENTYRWLGQYLERLGIPPWLALYNPDALGDPAQQADLKRILNNLQNVTSAAIPRPSRDDFEIWTPSATSNVQAVFIPAIETFKRDMARGLLMPGQLGISPDVAEGSLAKARVALDMFLLSLSAIQSQLSEIIQQQVVNPLVDMNYLVGGEYPQFNFLPLSTEDAQGIVGAWAQLVDLDIVNVDDDDEQHLRALLKFPRRDVDDVPDHKQDGQDVRIPYRYLQALAPALTKNEVRATLGLDPMDGGDEPMNKSVNPPPVIAAPVDPNAPPDPNNPDDPNAPPDPKGGQDGGATGDGGGKPPADGGKPPAPTAGDKAKAAAKGGVTTNAFAPFLDFAEAAAAGVEGDTASLEIPAPDTLGPIARRCDFVAITKKLDGLEDDVVSLLAVALRKAVTAQITAWRKKPPTLAKAGKVAFDMPMQAHGLVTRTLKRAYNAGRAHVRDELGKAKGASFADLPTYDPDAALAYLEAKADLVIRGMTATMTDAIRNEILSGLRNGLPFTTTASRLPEILAPFIGPGGTVDPASLRPDRLLTIVRTITTDAYNQGRVIEARNTKPDGLVTGMQHTSVIDKVTTPICRSLDGRCYKINDPALDTMTPPLHYRCRSVLVAIVFTDDISDDPADADHWATPEELAAAQRLMPGQFGGSYTATPKNAPKG